MIFQMAEQRIKFIMYNTCCTTFLRTRFLMVNIVYTSFLLTNVFFSSYQITVSKILVATGYNQDVGSKTSEISDLTVKGSNMWKNWPKLPIGLFGATGGLIGDTVIICGGQDPWFVYFDECYSLTSQKATLVTHMSVARNNPASIVINDNTLWVTGGFNQGSSKDQIFF